MTILLGVCRLSATPRKWEGITSYLQRLRVALGGELNEPDTVARSTVHSQFIEDDVIV
jgi:hypothetical protein